MIENKKHQEGDTEKANAHAIESHDARTEDAPNLSERILDKNEAEQDSRTLEQKAQDLKEKLKIESEENTQRSDNQTTSDRILDKEKEDEEAH